MCMHPVTWVALTCHLLWYLEVPIDRNMTYTAFLAIAILGSIVVPVPATVSSAAGIIGAADLRKQCEKTGYLIFIGICNIAVSLALVSFWLYALLIGGAGV